MKKILFLLSFFLVVGINANAQSKSCAKSCAKSCSKAKTASADAVKTTSVAAAYMEADEAASANEMIEKRVCAKSGAVAYYEKAVCSKSGKVSFNEVTFDSDAKAFVNVSPLDAGDMKVDMKKVSSEKACSADCAKACCAGVSKKECSKMSKKECAKKCSGAKKTGA